VVAAWKGPRFRGKCLHGTHPESSRTPGLGTTGTWTDEVDECAMDRAENYNATKSVERGRQLHVGNQSASHGRCKH
jgi:hypothetical protein